MSLAVYASETKKHIRLIFYSINVFHTIWTQHIPIFVQEVTCKFVQIYLKFFI